MKTGGTIGLVLMLALAGCETAMQPAGPVAEAFTPGDEIVTPPWAERRPSPADYLQVYPPKARRLGVNSSVRLDCTVRDDRRLDCTPQWEEVPDLGFGAAGVEVSRLFVMKKTDDPELQPGKKVSLPIRFMLAE